MSATTSTTMTAEQAQRKADSVLSKLATAVPHVKGALLASPDGRALAWILTDQEPRSTAAIVASSRGLGQRLAELAGTSDLDEIVVRSSAGYVVIYSLGAQGAVTVLAEPSVNLAMLHLRARDTVKELGPVIDYIDNED